MRRGPTRFAVLFALLSAFCFWPQASHCQDFEGSIWHHEDPPPKAAPAEQKPPVSKKPVPGAKKAPRVSLGDVQGAPLDDLLKSGGNPKEAFENYEKSRENDPLRCFWRTDKGAVAVGETFNLIVACRTIKSGSASTSINREQFSSGALKVSPYEIVSASESRDVFDGRYRFFQYEYALRIIGKDFFGRDVPIPELEFVYALTVTTPEGKSVETRDIKYRMPQLEMKVLSLAPLGASDIRDNRLPTLRDIEGRRFRAKLSFVGSVALSVIALLLLAAWTIGFFFGRKRNKRRESGDLLGKRTLARFLAAEGLSIGRLRAKNGCWDGELISHALALFRVLGALALGCEIVQNVADENAKGLEGQLKMKVGFLRRRQIMIFSGLTPEEIEIRLAGAYWLKDDEKRKALLSEFSAAFAELNVARYGYGDPSESALDALLDRGMAVAALMTRDGSRIVGIARKARKQLLQWRGLWKALFKRRG